MEFHVYENARAACEAAGVLIAAQITRKGRQRAGSGDRLDPDSGIRNAGAVVRPRRDRL